MTAILLGKKENEVNQIDTKTIDETLKEEVPVVRTTEDVVVNPHIKFLTLIKNYALLTRLLDWIA